MMGLIGMGNNPMVAPPWRAPWLWLRLVGYKGAKSLEKAWE